MTDPLPQMPEFPQYFQEVFGYPPLPWQSRLADLATKNLWPANVGIQTGLGKTATIAIGVYALAAQAHLPPAERTAPTRIYYVVDRRLLVDEATNLSERIARQLSDASEAGPNGPHPALYSVSQRLRWIGGDSSRPLHVARLRGGSTNGARNGSDRRTWRPVSPIQPSIICSTVAMFGSRLLFRGYGSSRWMWPIDAALTGCDVLLLLDEAHLAEPLQKLLGNIQDCDARPGSLLSSVPQADPTERTPLLPAGRDRVRLVNLSATGNDEDVFRLDTTDLAHPLVQRRLGASKPTALVETTDGKLADALVEEFSAAMDVAANASDGHGSMAGAIFVNQPSIARAVEKKLRKWAKAADGEVLLLTGQLRPFDSEAVKTSLLEGESSLRSGNPRNLARPVAVVATQTLEVGADLDFDVVVSQSASARAITQRWGRLNRLGDRPHAQGVVVHPVGKEDPVYGSAAETVWTSLWNAIDHPLEMGPLHINELVGTSDELGAVVPELLPAHLWLWAKTSLESRPQLDPSKFFSGMQEDRGYVTVAWRSYVPPDKERIEPPIEVAETVEVSIASVQAWLKKQNRAGALESVAVLSEDNRHVQWLTTDQVTPGKTVILPTTAGGYSAATGWDPGSTEEVLDVSPMIAGLLPLTGASLDNLEAWVRRDVPDFEFKPTEDGKPADESRKVLATYVADLRNDSPAVADSRSVLEERLSDMLTALQDEADAAISVRLATAPPRRRHDSTNGHPTTGHVDQTPAPTSTDEQNQVVLFATWNLPSSNASARVLRDDVNDELSWLDEEHPDQGSARQLPVHLRQVRDVAGRNAQLVGLSQATIDAVSLAGHLHDVGKADRRFQSWLDITDADLRDVPTEGDPPSDDAPAGAEGGPQARSAGAAGNVADTSTHTLSAKGQKLSRGNWLKALRASSWPRGGRHELLSLQLIGQVPELTASAKDRQLVEHLVLAHHGRGRPMVPPKCDPAPLPSTAGLQQLFGPPADWPPGAEGVGHVEIKFDPGQTDASQPERFADLSERYGFWGVAFLETLLRQADHQVSSIVEVL